MPPNCGGEPLYGFAASWTSSPRPTAPGSSCPTPRSVSSSAAGLIHFHAIFRLDGLDPIHPERTVPPHPAFTAEVLADAIRQAASVTWFATVSHPARPKGWDITWGTQVDPRVVRLTNDGEVTDTAVASYLAKYATKSTEAVGPLAVRITAGNLRLYGHPASHQGRLILAGPAARPPSRLPGPAPLGRHARLPRPLRHQKPPLLHYHARPPRRPRLATPSASLATEPGQRQDPLTLPPQSTGRGWRAGLRRCASRTLPAALPVTATALRVMKSEPLDPEGGPAMEKLLYRPKEAAQALGISRDKLYDLLQAWAASVGQGRRCAVHHCRRPARVRGQAGSRSLEGRLMPPKKRPTRGRQRLSGEGTISGPRKDGRYVGAFYALTTAGARKRVYVYGRTREEAHERLVEEQSKAAPGDPGTRTVMEARALPRLLARACDQADPPTCNIRTVRDDRPHPPGARPRQVPAEAPIRADRAGIPQRQAPVGLSVRNVQIMRQVLSAALSRAVREELITRNVARLVELPAWEPSVVVPWSPAEALAFLQAAIDDPLYPAFVLLLLYGLRRGEVLGLRWQDIDFEAQIVHVRQQIHRSQGQLRIGPVKTRAGSRDLPLIGLARGAFLARKKQQQADQMKLGSAWADTGLVFTTRTGKPIEPRNLCARLFASGTATASARSAFTRSGTPPPHCSKTSACQHGIHRSSSGMRMSQPPSRSTPTWMKRPAARPWLGSTSFSGARNEPLGTSINVICSPPGIQRQIKSRSQRLRAGAPHRVAALESLSH